MTPNAFLAKRVGRWICLQRPARPIARAGRCRQIHLPTRFAKKAFGVMITFHQLIVASLVVLKEARITMKRFPMERWLGCCRIDLVLLAAASVLSGLCPCRP